MKYRTFTTAVILATGLGLAGGASAAWNTKDVTTILKWPTALLKAVKTAEHDSKGKAFLAMPDVNGLGYDIKVIAGDKILLVKVDSKTGKVATSTPSTDDKLADYADLTKLKSSLDAAITAAENAAKGTAIDATYKQGASPIFEVEVAKKDGTLKTVDLDAKTGKVQKVSALTSVKGANVAAVANVPAAARLFAGKSPAKSLAN